MNHSGPITQYSFLSLSAKDFLCENFIVHKSVIDIVTFQERAVDMEDYATVRRIKLEQCVQLATFKTDANQVSRWERNLENWILKWLTDKIEFLAKIERLNKTNLGDAMDPGYWGYVDR